MNTLRRAVLVLVVLTLPAGAAQPSSGLPEEFGALPQCTDVTLSPSGRMLAWQGPGGSADQVVTFDVGARAIRRVLRMPPGLRVEWLGWEDDDTLLIGAAETQRLPPYIRLSWGQAVRWSRVLAFDVTSGNSRVLLDDVLSGDPGGFQTGADLIAWAIPGRPHTVMMAADVENAGRYRPSLGTMIHDARGDSGTVSTLFAVDAVTGDHKAIASGDAYTHQWVLDADGNPVARSEWRSDTYAIYARQGGDWRQIYQRAGARNSNFQALWLDAKAQALLTIMPDADGGRHLWSIPLDGSAPKRMLPEVSQDVRSLEFDPLTHNLSAVWVGGVDEDRIWIDSASRLRYESVAGAFPGRQVWVYDLSRDGRETLAEVQDFSEPPIYYLIDFSNHSAVIAGQAYPQLAHVPLGTARSIQYTTEDGGTVRAQVVLPPGGTRDLPLVVLAPGERGGAQEFDWLAQYLAASGYAVLRPNIELTALPTEGGWIWWGGASQRYAVDGISQLVKQGVVDPRRVCIVGIGYGGYAALAGAAYFPSAYTCAVSINGISDLPSLLGHEINVFGEADSNHVALAVWDATIGQRSDPKLIAESPVHAAQAVMASVLLIHGGEDTVVPVEQSLKMDRALEKAGKRVTFMKLDGSDHSLDRASTRIEVLKAIGAFLSASLH